MDLLASLLQSVHSVVWGPPMLLLLLSAGLFYSLRTGFFQIFRLPTWFQKTFLAIFRDRKVHQAGDRGLSQFQTLTTALAGSIGIGNIAGVATALVAGGPGAVFWMWVSAILGMMLKYAENVLGVRYRTRDRDGKWVGGPMYYIERGLKMPKMAALFSLFCVLASLGSGNMAQVGSVSDVMASSFAVPKWVTGLVFTLVTGLIILGGLGRIGKVAERLVPLMAGFYLAGCLVILVLYWDALPGVFSAIFRDAFDLTAAGSGVLAYGFFASMRYGIARGVFSNEAGMGSASMVYATAEDADPEIQGMWGIFEVFLDTIVGCTLTALCILATGVLESGGNGATLAASAFTQALGPWGGVFVAVSTALFGFASLLGWSYYGERGVAYLWKERGRRLYQAVFLGCVFLGACVQLTAVWDFADTCNGLMALPNLIALLLLSKEVVKGAEPVPSRLSSHA